MSGQVRQPLTLTLDQIKARPRQEVVFTHRMLRQPRLPLFQSAASATPRWAGTPLAPILKEAGVLESGIEVVFWGTDDRRAHDDIRDVKFKQNFARSMSLADAMDPKNILCYEMNGQPLPPANGFPLRLIAPGWYGIANAKWLKRIEVRDTRFVSRFMGRDYVTLREEDHNGETLGGDIGRPGAAEIGAGRVTRRTVSTASSVPPGAAIAKVEVKIDDGPWLPATIDHSEEAEFAWKLWSLDWPTPRPASMPSPRGRPMQPGRSSPRWTIPGSPRSTPIGRATGRSPEGSWSAKPARHPLGSSTVGLLKRAIQNC